MWSTRSFTLVLVASVLLLQIVLAGALPPTTRLASRVPRPLKQVTTAQLIKRANRPKDYKKRQTSAVPFPPSGGGYVSTGTVPWAVYTNLDIDCSLNTRTEGINNQEACHLRCQRDSTCVATTWQGGTVNACYTCRNLIGYFATTVNGFRGSVRGRTCLQNALAVPPGYTCFTQYRAA